MNAGRLFRAGDGESSARTPRLLGALLAIALLSALIPAAASAVTTRLPLSFSPITGSSTGVSMQYPSGVAVDESTGNVFVSDSATNIVAIFDAEGGLPAGTISTKLEGLTFNGEESAVVVDNAATSPSKGTLYVVDVVASKVRKYVRNASTQLYEAAGEIAPTSGPAFAEPLGATVDANGNVYVADYGSFSVVKFSPTGTQLLRLSTTPAMLNPPSALAVDSAGDLFVHAYSQGSASGEVTKFPANGSGEVESTNFVTMLTQGNNGASGLAVDRATNQLFLARGNRIEQYDATTLAKQLEFGRGRLGETGRVVVNSASGRIYVTDRESDDVEAFGAETKLAGIVAEPTTNIAATSATLNALVNPDGLAVTDCKFEYGTTTSYGSSVPCSGAIPVDASDHAVTGPLTGLTPGATYHFRVSATNANGTNRTEDATFDTRNPAVTNPATNVKGTKATLNGSVNPEGAAVTNCKFEYGTTTAYGSSIPCAGAIPIDESPHAVTADLTGLTPNSTLYHFRIVITGGAGTVAGADRTFSTANTVTTSAATNVKGTKASLSGSVNPEGTAVTDCKFEYGTTTAYGSSIPCVGAIPTDESAHAVTADLTHLAPNQTTYHFRLAVTGGSGVVRSTDQTFATTNTVITTAATAIATTAATLNGTLNPEGIEYTNCKFEYGTTTSYGSTAPCAESPATIGTGTSAVPVHADISGLAVGITYHVRLVGTNVDGSAKGNDVTFTTLGPVIAAAWADSVAYREASLKAQVKPGGLATTYHLEWGLDSSYGNSTPERSAGSDSSLHIVTFALEGLTPGTTYHWRAVATNSLGTTFGPDRAFKTYEPQAENTSCPNREFRIGSGALLPDCRAYEMVSPVEKNGADISTKAANPDLVWAALNQSATDGSKFTYSSYGSFAGAQGSVYSSQYLSQRGADGWTTRSISPPRIAKFTEYLGVIFESEYRYFTPDLSSGVFTYSDQFKRLTSDSLAALPNIFERKLTGAEGYEAFITQETGLPTHGFGPPFPDPEAFSRDGTYAAFGMGVAPLTPDANDGKNLQTYLRSDDGELHLVSVRPDGTASTGDTAVGAGTGGADGQNRVGQVQNAVSADGSRVVWREIGSPSILYVRKNAMSEQSISGACDEPGKACTVRVNSGTEGPSNAPAFEAADADVSTVLYKSDTDLYEFNVEDETRSLIASGMEGSILGGSEDLSYLYFASRASLTPDASGANPKLYLYHEGEYTLIASLSNADPTAGTVSSFSKQPMSHAARVTPDGRHIAFMSAAGIPTINYPSGYDNTHTATGQPASEVYTYDAESGDLYCASCNPSGARPQAALVKLGPDEISSVRKPLSAAWITPWNMQYYGQRALSDDGQRLFFNSSDTLVPRDTNGRLDVYQWEAPGSGDCDEAGGCISLISNGRSAQDSEFFDASASGDDVFFKTASAFDPRDPGLLDVYDARVSGGFPLAAPPAPCEGEACQTPPAPPNDPTPASAGFRGAGDPQPSQRRPRRNCRARKRERQGKGGKASKNARKHAKRGCKQAKRGAAR